MSGLTPFLVSPEFFERVWGARDLRPYFNRVATNEPIGEVWLTGDTCQVASGDFVGTTLGELAARCGRELTGEAAPQAERFPLLVKFLFPQQRLSVQVHPDDAAARAVGGQSGKTECWYVVEAGRDAQMGVGLQAGVTREQLRVAIASQQAEHLLNWIGVRGGELIYVDAGTVHAVGPNAVIVETQQNSDITYRLYDYGRPRTLHLEAGLAAMHETTGAGLVERSRSAVGETLVASPCFVIERLPLEQPLRLARVASECRSAQVLVMLSGQAVLESDDAAPLVMARGAAAIVPATTAAFVLRPQGSAELLRMRLPGVSVAEPRTKLHT